MSVAYAEDESGDAVPSTAERERVDGLGEVGLVLLSLLLDPFEQLCGVNLEGGEFASLPLYLVDSLRISDNLNHANLVAGGQARVRSHTEVQTFHMPNVIHHGNNYAKEIKDFLLLKVGKKPIVVLFTL